MKVPSSSMTQKGLIPVKIVQLKNTLPPSSERQYYIYSPAATWLRHLEHGKHIPYFLGMDMNWCMKENAAKIALKELTKSGFPYPCYGFLASEVDYQSVMLGSCESLLHWLNSEVFKLESAQKISHTEK